MGLVGTKFALAVHISTKIFSRRGGNGRSKKVLNNKNIN
ncbi:MAG: hypothetical protein A4E62_00883 [Syntrophorhabdus sp. PtaU1.Bin002]|nr:MAG: hypothetical protein A4E62_00883 [Syntrophorhabdus sp. PtaU1.Bin002]